MRSNASLNAVCLRPVVLVILAVMALLRSAPIDALAPVGPGFVIGLGADQIGGHPAIAFGSGRFLVTWGVGSPRARRIAADGTVEDGGGIVLGGNSSAVPSVAFDGVNFLVVWAYGGAVFGSRVAHDGTLLDSPPLQLASDTKDRPIAIAFDGVNYLIAWRTASDQVRAARVTPGGVNLDGDAGFLVAPSQGFYPWIACSAAQCLVVWYGSAGAGLDVLAARVLPDGAVLDAGGFIVCGATGDQEHASVASDGSDFFVAWHDVRGGNEYNGSARGARVTAAGTVLDDPALVVGEYALRQPPAVVAFDGTDYVTAWQSAVAFKYRHVDAFARRIAPDGAFVDARPVPLATNAGVQSAPTLAHGAQRYLAAWSERGGRCAGGCAYGRLFAAAAEPSPAPSLPGLSGIAGNPAGAWGPWPNPAGQAVNSVWGYDRQHVYAVTERDDGMLLRYDGTQWTAVAYLPNARKYGLTGDGPDSVWTVGWCWNVVRYKAGEVQHTNCTIGDTNATSLPIGMGIWRPDALNVMTVGVQGYSVRYEGTDLDQPDLDAPTWRSVATGTGEDLWDVWGSTADQAIAVGAHGTVLRYHGAAWSVEPGVPAVQSLNAVWGAAPNDVYVVGDFGTILHWNGVEWNAHDSGTAEHLSGVAGRGVNDVYAVGQRGTILHYDGAGWQPEASGTLVGLNDVDVAGIDVWAVGDAGTILGKLEHIFVDGFEFHQPSE